MNFLKMIPFLPKKKHHMEHSMMFNVNKSGFTSRIYSDVERMHVQSPFKDARFVSSVHTDLAMMVLYSSFTSNFDKLDEPDIYTSIPRELWNVIW